MGKNDGRARRPEQLTEPLLQRQYVREGRSARSIAAAAGLPVSTVNEALDRYGIPRRGRGRPRKTTVGGNHGQGVGEFLRYEYGDRRRTGSSIAAELGVTPQRVYQLLAEHGIPRRTATEAPADIAHRLGVGRDDLVRMHVSEAMSVTAIARSLGVSRHQVSRLLDHYGIQETKQPLAVSEAELRSLYLDEGLSIEKCAERLGATRTQVSTAMRRYGVPARSQREAAGRGMGKVLTKEWLRVRQQAGMTQTEMAAEAGTTQRTVRDWLVRHGLLTEKPDPHTALLSPALLRRAITEERRTVAEVAELLGIPPQKVRRAAVEAGVKLFDPSQPTPLTEGFIRAHLTAGASVAEIAARTGRSLPAVYRRMQRFGIAPPTTGNATELWPGEVVPLVTEGLTVNAIAERLGVSRRKVEETLAREGVTASTDPRWATRRRLDAEMTADVLRQLYVNERRTIEEIATMFRCSPSAVSRRLTQAGIRSRQAHNETRR